MMLGWSPALPGGAVEPPLPGEDGPRPAAEVFQPLLLPGDTLPPGSEAPALPEGPAVLPPELFPESGPVTEGDPSAMLPEPLDSGLPVDLPKPGELAPPPLLPPPSQSSPSLLPSMEMGARAYWHKSPREAREVARRERKPLLLFFYQKWKSAPMASMGASGGDNNIAMNDDLLATPEFNEFASSHLVLTRLFYPIGSPDKKVFTPERLAALQQFKEYFKVKGFPCLILLDENGREIERQTGYVRTKTGRGVDLSRAGPILERLKTAVLRREAVIAAADEKMDRLLKQNYREWTSQAGTKLLAKLVSSTASEVILMDAEGELRRVASEQLCIVDRAVISRQAKGMLPAPHLKDRLDYKLPSAAGPP